MKRILVAAACILLPFQALAGTTTTIGPNGVKTADLSDQAAGTAAQAPAQPTASCSGTGDLTELLSPGCLDSLKALRAPTGAAPVVPSAPTPANVPTQCNIAIFGGSLGAASGFQASSGAGISFTATSLSRCIEQAAHLSYGVQGITNITATDPTYGVVAVTCRRETQDGRRITCKPQ